jgi:hypothetical protein
MGLGKWLVVVGLAANIIGAICLGHILPRESTTTYGSAVPRPFTPLGRFANRVAWPLLALGFFLQLVGTVLWT